MPHRSASLTAQLLRLALDPPRARINAATIMEVQKTTRVVSVRVSDSLVADRDPSQLVESDEACSKWSKSIARVRC